MKWSKFVHYFPSFGLLWHALSMEIIWVAKDSAFEFFPEGRVDAASFDYIFYNHLVAKGFVVTDSQNPKKESEPFTRRENAIQSLFLILATSCNLRCDYCLYNSSKSGSLAVNSGKSMQEDVARQAIRLFSDKTSANNRSSPDYWECITFYGGEPLLNFDCLQKAVGYVRHLQSEGKIWKNIRFVVNTNGTLLTKEIASFFKKENIEVQVSIDGPEEVHDAVRMFHSGQGSFASVISGLELIKSLGVGFIPLITVTDTNMDYLTELVVWLCNRFAVKKYGFNLLMQTDNIVDPTYGLRASEAMRKAHEAAKAFGAVDDCYVSTIESFWSKRVAHNSCGVGKKIVVFPKGDMHVCQALERSGTTSIGKLPEFDPKSPNLLAWRQRDRFGNPTCLACPAIGVCQGGCGASAYNATGNICGIDPNYCGWMTAEFHHWISSQSQ